MKFGLWWLMSVWPATSTVAGVDQDFGASWWCWLSSPKISVLLGGGVMKQNFFQTQNITGKQNLCSIPGRANSGSFVLQGPSPPLLPPDAPFRGINRAFGTISLIFHNNYFYRTFIPQKFQTHGTFANNFTKVMNILHSSLHKFSTALNMN